jgi:5-methyltetrahydrofolate--homocysteine methyltransferase
MLEGAGFAVVDLGVDVAPDKVVEAVKENDPDIVALSALLTTTMEEQGNIIGMLEDAGLRDTAKIIIGGAPVTKEFGDKIGADGYADDAVSAVTLTDGLSTR